MEISYGRGLLAERYGPGARDQRLEEFAQGRWADVSGASGWLALQAGDVSRPEVLADATGDELLGIGRAWKSLEAWCFTGKLTVVRELIRRYPLFEDGEPGAAVGGPPGEWDPRLHHEVAAALGISVAAAGKLADLAWMLDARLPGISQALDEGRLDPGRVKMIVDEASVLETEELFTRAEAIILVGLPTCKTWADLQRLVQRAVITVDPDGARRRRERAEREHARIAFWRESTGTCALRGTGLPTDQALAATAHIEARALEYKAAQVKRPMDILRVMAYLDLINGVTVSQRVAWIQAEDEAHAAEDAARAARDAGLREAAAQARDKFRQKTQEQARPGGGSVSRPGHPGEPGPDESGEGRPYDGARDDSAHDDSTDGDGPGPGDGWDDGGCGSGPESTGGGPPGGGSPGGGLGGRPGSGGGDHPGSGQAGLPCPECGGTDGAGGLPMRANFTLAAAAVPWLAQQASPGHSGPWGNSGLRDTAPGHSQQAPGRTGGKGPRARGPGGGGGGGGPGSPGASGPDPCPACGNGGTGTMPARGNLVFPLLTLLGLAERPGEAHGLGALDPALVRDLAAAGARDPASALCVTITDDQGYGIGHGCCKPIRGKAATSVLAQADRATFTPSARAVPSGGYGSWVLTVPGAPAPFTVDIGPVPVYGCDHRHAAAAYAPGDKLRHLIQVRDGACSFPACSRHARESDFEHARAFNKGGLTCACNAHACSRSCHRVKQSPGWAVTKPRPGWTQWTTMTGRTYTQGPWRYPA